MLVYGFPCTTCHAVYDERRPMADADAPATCPTGHTGAARLLPIFATTGLASPRPAGGLCGAPRAGGCGGGRTCC